MYIHDISHAMAASAGKNGVSEPVFRRTLNKAVDAVQTLKSQALPLITQCIQLSDIEQIEQVAAEINARYSTVVVCGMGGSSLSGKMLAALALNPVTHKSGKTNLIFLDNIDPHCMDTLIASLDFASTMFLMISKSGGTAETLTHISILWEAAQARIGAEEARDHFIAITEPRDNALARFAKQRGIRCLDHSTGIGGRYAALTIVGLLPAAIAGLNIRAIRKGACKTIDRTFHSGESAAAAEGAALSAIMAEQGKNICIILPYCDRLGAFAMWHRQIWAESLGKEGKGITPAPALGAVDQHSQLQLYLDGPRDKFFTMLLLDQRGKGPSIPLMEESLAYLKDHTIGDLMDAQQYATLETFTGRQCPVRVLSMSRLDEEAIGSLTMHFMLETILTAHLMGIDPFNQPAVEEGKKLAIKRLSSELTA